MKIKINKRIFLDSMMKKISLSDDELAAIRAYQSPGNDGKSREINQALYDDDAYTSPEIQQYIDALTRACDKGILEYQMEVLRGENDFYGIADSKNDSSLVGKVFEKKGFLSTSISRPHDRQITYKITVPKGTHCLYLRNLAQDKVSGEWEDELLIQRGYMLQFDKIVRDETGPTVYAHLIIN